ncbi:MAG: 2-C-methyl-D-erythritol 4-phosphate cytidylyltransferase [Bacteroidota bacterium]
MTLMDRLSILACPFIFAHMIPTAIIVAGGSGKRMKISTPKQFLLLDGVPILVHTVRRFLNWHQELQLALVLPEAHFPTWKEMAIQHLNPVDQERILLCKGGSSRTASVWAGISALVEKEGTENALVAIHDGVRPFISDQIMKSAFEMAAEKGACVVCVPVKASLRKKEGHGSVAVDRSAYFEVQTPQVFHLKKIEEAFLQRKHDSFTDDASLYQDMGGEVSICEGSYDNIKITTPEDLAVGLDILRRLEG